MTSLHSHAHFPRARPLPHTFVPVRTSMIGTPAARTEFANAMAAVVDTLATARELVASGDRAALRALLHRADRELDAADEKLLMLDRRRHRSIFLRSERLRSRLAHLHGRIG
ncbi:MAG: hypothetical protein U1F54_02630 [Burkholderiales bacterium]